MASSSHTFANIFFLNYGKAKRCLWKNGQYVRHESQGFEVLVERDFGVGDAEAFLLQGELTVLDS